MKRFLCIILSVILSFSSISLVYASSSDNEHGGTGGTIGDGTGGTGGSDGDHGGTGGSTGMPSLAPVDPTIADQVVMKILCPQVTEAIDFLNKIFNPETDLDDDTRNYIKENAKDNVTSDGNYYYINQNFIQNINQKVQDRVHALDGYYYYDVVGAKDYNSFLTYFKLIAQSSRLDNPSPSDYKDIQAYLDSCKSIIVAKKPYSSEMMLTGILDYDESRYLFVVYNGNVRVFDTTTKDFCDERLFNLRSYSNRGQSTGSPYYMFSYYDYCSGGIGALGQPVKIFYSTTDVFNYLNNGRKYFPNLPNRQIKIPINYTSINPILNLDFDVSAMTETEIQQKIDLAFSAWFDKLLEISVKPTDPTPTPGGSGGTGGTTGEPTPSPSPGGSAGDFTSDAVNYLEKIYNWLVLFGETHGTFTKKVSDYIEENKGKLDEIIVAINAIGTGKTEGESNGCKYDFSALSAFMQELWNNSDEKFDTMIDLLEENNEYQQRLVTSLNEIKAILVTQTIMELFQDRSSETANKAKEKFPTSIPWDVAMVVNAMAAEPQPIKLSLPVKINSLNINEKIEIDLTADEWEKLAKTCRYLLSILFILFMIQLSRKLFFNGEVMIKWVKRLFLSLQKRQSGYFLIL